MVHGFSKQLLLRSQTIPKTRSVAVKRRPFWSLSKQEQKLLLEDHIRDWLVSNGPELEPHQRHFLREALEHIESGLFGMAAAALMNVREDSGKFDHHCMDPLRLRAATVANLRRTFMYIEGAPAREQPVFRWITVAPRAA